MLNSGKRRLLCALLIAMVSVILAMVFFLYGRQGLFWDAGDYAQLGERIATKGLFQFNDDTRTFGYPLFISLIWAFPDHQPSTIRLLVFLTQLLVFLGACFLAYHVFERIFGRGRPAVLLLALLAFNPFLLIYTGVVLSDLLSAILDFVALLLAVRPMPQHSNGTSKDIAEKSTRSILTYTFLSFLAAGCAVMVRPANVVIGLAVAAVWVIRFLVFREGKVWSLLAIALGFCIPLVPQLVNNYRAYGQLQPLIVRSLYDEQLNWGMRYLKYASVALPGISSGVPYPNPFWSPSITSFSGFLPKAPLEFLLTLAIHLFALFDHDYAYPFITNVNAGYRFPLAILNDVFLGGALFGVLAWLPRALRPRSFTPLDLGLAGMLIGILVYLPEYIPVAVEPRFSLPLYLFLSPFFIYALLQIHTWRTGKHLNRLVLLTLGVSIFLTVNLGLYFWLHSLVPLLDATADSPTRLDRYPIESFTARFGDRIELTGYGVDRTRQARGGDTLYFALDWLCKGTSTDSIDVQIDLEDPKGHLWSRMTQNPYAHWSPCINRLWVSSPATDIVALSLPVVIPSGEYKIVLSLYDRANDRYLTADPLSGGSIGEHVPVTSLSVAKNKASFAANQIQIENPLFVDMREMRFLGYTAIPDQARLGDGLDIGFYWRARSKPRGDYIVTVQLRDSANLPIVEQSARPAEGTYPTTLWDQGEVLLDWHRIDLTKSLLEGEYDLVAILRDVGDGQVLGEAKFSKISITR